MNLARHVHGKIIVDIPIRVVRVSRWRQTATLAFEGEPGLVQTVTLRPGDSLTLHHTTNADSGPRFLREPS